MFILQLLRPVQTALEEARSQSVSINDEKEAAKKALMSSFEEGHKKKEEEKAPIGLDDQQPAESANMEDEEPKPVPIPAPKDPLAGVTMVSASPTITATLHDHQVSHVVVWHRTSASCYMLCLLGLGGRSELVGESFQAWYASNFRRSDGSGEDPPVHCLPGLHQGHFEDPR